MSVLLLLGLLYIRYRYFKGDTNPFVNPKLWREFVVLFVLGALIAMLAFYFTGYS